MSDRFSYLIELFDKLDIVYSEEQVNQFELYYDLLIEWNSFMNLTSITDLKDVIIKHFIDSIILSKYCNLDKDISVIDVGTGAGFPGIPLKIMNPDINICLLDSLNKRVNFLNCVIDNLNLSGIEAIHGRAEDLGHNTKYREKFDICVSRAVANLSTLSEYCIPFVKKDGYFIPYKSGNIEDELLAAESAFNKLNSKVVNTYSFTLPDSDFSRTFILINKYNFNSKIYPRKAGTPSKTPL